MMSSRIFKARRAGSFAKALASRQGLFFSCSAAGPGDSIFPARLAQSGNNGSCLDSSGTSLAHQGRQTVLL